MIHYGDLLQTLKAETENGYLVSKFCIVACLVLYNFVECAEPASSLFSSYTDLWSVWFPNSRMYYITLCEHLWNSRCNWFVIILHNQHQATCCTKQGNASVHIFILLKGKEEDAVIKFSTAPLLQNCDVFQDCGACFSHVCTQSTSLNSIPVMPWSIVPIDEVQWLLM